MSVDRFGDSLPLLMVSERREAAAFARANPDAVGWVYAERGMGEEFWRIAEGRATSTSALDVHPGYFAWRDEQRREERLLRKAHPCPDCFCPRVKRNTRKVPA